MKIRNVCIAVLCFVLVSPILAGEDCDNVVVEGAITVISASEITVDGTTVNIEGAEITVTKDKIPFTEDLVDGMTVKASGLMVEGVLVAVKVSVMYGGAIK